MDVVDAVLGGDVAALDGTVERFYGADAGEVRRETARARRAMTTTATTRATARARKGGASGRGRARDARAVRDDGGRRFDAMIETRGDATETRASRVARGDRARDGRRATMDAMRWTTRDDGDARAR